MIKLSFGQVINLWILIHKFIYFLKSLILLLIKNSYNQLTIDKLINWLFDYLPDNLYW
jgi:hypothetical protein